MPVRGEKVLCRDVKGGASVVGAAFMYTMVFWRWFSVSSSDLWASNSSAMLFSFWVFSLVRLASLILSFCIWALIGGMLWGGGGGGRRGNVLRGTMGISIVWDRGIGDRGIARIGHVEVPPCWQALLQLFVQGL